MNLNQNKVELKLDWCSHQAAKYAVEHWHYSKSLPPPPHNRIGVWEQNKYIGCVLFSRGATGNLGKPYGLLQTQCCELTRVALQSHKTPVSRIISIALLFLKKQCPGIVLVISFADPNQGHHGGIYQSGGWVYSGKTEPSVQYISPDNKIWHPRMIKKQGFTTCYGIKRKTLTPSECVKIAQCGKHRYLKPLNSEMRKQIEPLRKPYPKKCATSIENDAAGFQPEKGGVIPTVALQ